MLINFFLGHINLQSHEALLRKIIKFYFENLEPSSVRAFDCLKSRPQHMCMTYDYEITELKQALQKSSFPLKKPF